MNLRQKSAGLRTPSRDRHSDTAMRQHYDQSTNLHQFPLIFNFLRAGTAFRPRGANAFNILLISSL